ncbi:c-type cytochrome [Ruegeria marina]|uniref:Cytochrome c n=1 Tax=Ruegeria marina TaxID=639004 RepID=A0A1G6QRQ9_9RHOB|nr:cytochrome c [Ruegeria marina]
MLPCFALKTGNRVFQDPANPTVRPTKADHVPVFRRGDTLGHVPIELWTGETINLLFDLGPDHYIPGSKMPMQRITGAQDRTGLISHLRPATHAEDQK